MDSSSYKNKYLKYKTKYLNTKNNSSLEPVASNFIKQIESSNDPPIYKLSINQARDVLNNIQKDNKSLDMSSNDIINFNISYDVPFSVTLIRPKLSNNKLLPVVLYVHGGGWILGNIMTHARLLNEIVSGSGVAILFVNYTLSPEARFPVAIEQSYKALEFIQTLVDYNLDSSRICVMGDSVGGNMATALTELSIRRNGPKISYLVLLYPVTDPSMSTSSYQQFENGPWLTKNAMTWFWNAYEPSIDKRNNDLISLLKLTEDQLSKFPSTLIIVDENDVLRDEGEQFAHKLMNYIGPNKNIYAIRVLGTIHDFLMLNPVASSNPTKGTIDIINMNLKKYLAHI